MKERGRQSTGERHAGLDVADGWPRQRDQVGAAFGHTGRSQAASQPIGRAIEPAPIGLRPFLSESGSPAINDPWVRRLDVRHIDSKLGARGRQKIRDENVSFPHQFEHDVPPGRNGDVDADGSLTPVEGLPHECESARPRGDLPCRQAADRIAPFRVLHLDNVCTPVGQDGAGRRNHRVLGDLQHADTLHDLGHASLLCRPLATTLGSASIGLTLFRPQRIRSTPRSYYI